MEDRISKLERVVTNNATVSADMWNRVSAYLERSDLILEALVDILGVDDTALMERVAELNAQRQPPEEEEPEEDAGKDSISPESIMQGGGEAPHDSRAFVFGGDE